MCVCVYACVCLRVCVFSLNFYTVSVYVSRIICTLDVVDWYECYQRL